MGIVVGLPCISHANRASAAHSPAFPRLFARSMKSAAVVQLHRSPAAERQRAGVTPVTCCATASGRRLERGGGLENFLWGAGVRGGELHAKNRDFDTGGQNFGRAAPGTAEMIALILELIACNRVPIGDNRRLLGISSI